MQDAKDSFYMALRNRLNEINPGRTIVIRGTVRPGILVEEAEASLSQAPSDVFIVRWLAVGVDQSSASTLIAQECEISYHTSGSQSFGGLDRGRLLSALDRELITLLQLNSTPKLSYTATPPATMLTRVFWDDPTFGPLVTQRDKLSRSVRVMVYSYEESGE